MANNLQSGAAGWTANSSSQLTQAAYSPYTPSLPGGTALSYDASGNLVSLSGSSLTYDEFGEMASAGSASYSYNAAGERVSKTVSGVSTFYLYQGGSIIAELDGNGNITRSYNWGPLGLISDTSSGFSRFYLYDGLGNTRQILDSNGVVQSQGAYSAWGNPNSASYPASPFCWKGRYGAYFDSESGLYQMGARYYSPNFGRFLSRDPSGFSAGANLYAYCAGDPVNFFDTNGCEARPDDGTLWDDLRWLDDHTNFLPGGNPGTSALLWGHDAFRDWGNTEGRNDAHKVKPHELWMARLNAGLAFGNAVLTFAGPALAAARQVGAAAEAAEACAGGRCFVAGTPVAVAPPGTTQSQGRTLSAASSTSYISIENIKIGQLVATRDPDTGRTEYRRVARTKRLLAYETVTITLADAKTGRVVDTLTGTPEHPFFVEHGGMVAMGDLKIGQHILTRCGGPVAVRAISRKRHSSGILVYNFDVTDDHTYFVGKAAGGDWVHNDYDRAARLEEYFSRLLHLPAAETPDEALEQVRNTLNAVEDDLSGVPYHPVPGKGAPYSGRMYPPFDDSVIVNSDGSLSAETRGHNIELDPTGGISITTRKGIPVFRKPGRG